MCFKAQQSEQALLLIYFNAIPINRMNDVHNIRVNTFLPLMMHQKKICYLSFAYKWIKKQQNDDDDDGNDDGKRRKCVRDLLGANTQLSPIWSCTGGCKCAIKRRYLPTRKSFHSLSYLLKVNMLYRNGELWLMHFLYFTSQVNKACLPYIANAYKYEGFIRRHIFSG